MKPLNLKKISAFIVATMIFSIHANGQIVYTNVNPDLTSSSYNLDLNNDGTTDFVIAQTTTSVTSPSGYCTGTKTNRYLKIQPAAGNQVLSGILNLNTVVEQSSATWTNAITLASSTNLCTASCGTSPICLPSWHTIYSTAITGKYFGLKFMVGGQTYYGWLHASATASPLSCTIIDYGYNNIPNQRILTGQSVAADYIFVSPTGNTFCAGASINIPYIISGNFGASNLITAQLSDANGTFTSPVNIGSIISNTSGTMPVTISPGTVTGVAYRIRLLTSNPVKSSSDVLTTSNNGINLIVNNSLPSAIITSNGSTNVCDGNVAMSTPTASGNSYQWKLNGTNIPNAIYYIYTAAAAGNYTCIKSNGCGSVTSNTITLTSTPVAAVITASGTTTTCGTNVSLYTTAGSGNTYQWKLNGNAILNATSSSYSAPATGDYSCVKTSGCGSITSNTISVVINPLPATAAITATGATTVCNGTVALNTNAIAGISYQWYYNSGIIAGATGTSYAAGLSGSYYVRETNGFGCFRNSNSVPILVGSPLATVSPSTGSICHGNPVILYAYPSGTSYTYQWKKNGVIIPGATSQSYSASHSGTYSAIVTIPSSACSNTSSGSLISNGCREASPFSTSEGNELQFLVAPNPTSQSTVISWYQSEKATVSLKIFDINGRLVTTLTDKIFEDGGNELTWNTDELDAGIYFLQFQTTGDLLTKKLIVTK